VYRRLVEQRQAVNITGEKGAGRGRVLKDLEQVITAEGRHVLLIDFNRNQRYYELLEQIESQMLLKKMRSQEEILPKPVQAEYTQFPITSLFMSYFNPKGAPYLYLLLDNIDRILDNPQQRFPKAFFDDLNYLNNSPYIFIACTTNKAIGVYQIYYVDENEREEDRLSWLHFPAPLDVSPLQVAEIEAELNRCLSDNDHWQGQADYIAAIQTHPASAQFLEYVVNNFDSHEALPIPQHLERLKARFNHHYPSAH